MKQPVLFNLSGASSAMRQDCAETRGRRGFVRVRRFAFVLFLVASCALFEACSSVDSAGTIPRPGVHAPRSAYRLNVINDMLFEFGETPLEKKTVNLPKGEYVLEAEDDIFLYFRAPDEMEYRVYHKEHYAEGVFQLGGIALARREKWDGIEYPACTYIDGDKQNEKRLTCPLEPAFLMQKRGTDWDSDFDKSGE